MGEETVLLALVETMNLVDKENRGHLVLIASFSGLFHDLPHLLDSGEHRGEEDEIGAAAAGQNPGQGGFAAAGGSPEQQGGNGLQRQEFAEHLVPAQQLFLAGKVFY